MIKISRQQAEALASAALDQIHDRLYEPWEWSDMDSLPKGHSSWTDEAVQDYMEKLTQRMADGIMVASRAP